ncbi:hypothetical protein CDD80_1606 [Ophiocordyceps camponoti-rufipedis]|uniref:Uncharacterized protein n=1 Tax=Ophiocordyceps camponoti-rufipedis TaxID=2004952 RepID=A0A2C5Z5P6_9HYPO|nr:hypothetical protein CDD80_1606 [Ophiocordyceps camponoti-rufipedis]
MRENAEPIDIPAGDVRFNALLGSDNGKGIARMLLDRPGMFGLKIIKRVRFSSRHHPRPRKQSIATYSLSPTSIMSILSSLDERALVSSGLLTPRDERVRKQVDEELGEPTSVVDLMTLRQYRKTLLNWCE